MLPDMPATSLATLPSCMLCGGVRAQNAHRVWSIWMRHPVYIWSACTSSMLMHHWRGGPIYAFQGSILGKKYKNW